MTMDIRPEATRVPSDAIRRRILLAGGLVSAVAVFYHFYAGTPEVMLPLYAAELPPAVVGVLDIVWYDVALLAAIGGIGMVAAAYRPHWRKPLAWFIGSHFVLLALICLVLSFVWFSDPWGLIQWAIFGPLGLMTIVVARGERG